MLSNAPRLLRFECSKKNKIRGGMPPDPPSFRGFFFGQFPCLMDPLPDVLLCAANLPSNTAEEEEEEEPLRAGMPMATSTSSSLATLVSIVTEWTSEMSPLRVGCWCPRALTRMCFCQHVDATCMHLHARTHSFARSLRAHTHENQKPV